MTGGAAGGGIAQGRVERFVQLEELSQARGRPLNRCGIDLQVGRGRDEPVLLRRRVERRFAEVDDEVVCFVEHGLRRGHAQLDDGTDAADESMTAGVQIDRRHATGQDAVVIGIWIECVDGSVLGADGLFAGVLAREL